MNIIKKTNGIIDKISGATKKLMRPKTEILFDPLQRYMTVGQYNVGKQEQTPNGRDYILVVYKDDEGTLHQALRNPNATDLVPEYIRKYDKRLDRFRAFVNKKTGRRYIVEQYLDEFSDRVKKYTRQGDNSINIGVLTDTHYKDSDSISFYGYNGLQHVKEFNYLEDLGLLDLKAHLGDWIDGSDAGLVSEQELYSLSRAFQSKKTNFAIIKGNHDENDKFDEHHNLKASFPENEFEDIMWPAMYAQKGINYISRNHGVVYFDKGDLRLIIVNTSDIPYILNDKGQKKYDSKISLAIREDQMQEIIEILESSSDKKIIFMSHGSPITHKGSNALKYNGRSLHELLVAFNQREKGYLNSHDVPAQFTLDNDFDFTKIKNSKIIAYFCGHRHIEDQFRINGIQYILFNCSALMGPKHALTTRYNKHWNRKIDLPSEYAGYVVNVDLKRNVMQIFGYGAASKRRIYRI